MTTITADLIRWRRSGTMYEGYVWNSIEPEFVEGKLIRMFFEQTTYYPTLTGYWDNHIIGRTAQGFYLRMEMKHQVLA